MLTEKCYVCEVHFKENDILIYDETILNDGIVNKIKRIRPTLKAGAVPFIFPNFPFYLTEHTIKRKPPLERSINSGSSHGNQYIRKIETFRQQKHQLQQQQQQQQTMSNAENCVTSKTTTPMKKSIQQQSMPLHDAPSQQTTCSKPVVETQIPTASVTQTSPVKDFENKRIKLEVESSINEKSEVKWPVKRKINKKERKKRLNARMRRLVSPKSPLMTFSELFKDVPIQLHSINNVTSYTATLEIDGQMYTANHISKTQAKQKACENFLRIMLTKKISEQSEKKEESPIETVTVDGENGTVRKPNGPPQEDFPWPNFASLAIHQWKLQPVSKAINLQEEQPNAIKSPPKAGARRKFPEDPKNCNPVQLINQMKPGVKFIETIISSTPPVFQVKCEIDNIPFIEQGSTKKAAKKECCIAAIKYFWHFDFHHRR
ncbi:unnamed protein product [Macrosiphum euphorbiae]|uniref:DRBM domain-containing protein n=1 Tax=Macrosiphum euphorbiae TaxID=13131 RepID=A0AAV0YAZ4_9HEMI|nr:unnamed protein product [Macrosiphum euphorbiae]